ncbi:MAG: DNA adenine methylase [Candidatus Cloacimonetes bacterium]|nr:DNA adenine methylase [Candidatus Cloacimonadota bacterium]
MFYSPLRYPGGKNKLAKFIAKICFDNDIKGHYVEPYAGGAAVALYLLLEGKVSKITINDFDRSVYAFWHSVLKDTEKLCDLIDNVEINTDNWQKAREIQKNKNKAPLLELGFSTFFLNRTNVSGIINAGVIGGIKQEGNYKMDCRFNRKELIGRIKNIAKYKKKITLYNLDAIDLIKKVQEESKDLQTIFYFDPPYYLKGESLYVNFYKHKDHQEISELIKNIEDIRWIVSYDDVPEIKEMYKGFEIKEYSFFHTAYKARRGNEVLVFSDNLKFSKDVNPTKI